MSLADRLFGGMHMAYGVAIREAINRGDISEMREVLAESKDIHRRQGDLKEAIKEIEDAIKNMERTDVETTGPGVSPGRPPKADGLFMVDLRSLKLSSEKQAEIDHAIQRAVVNSLADVDEARTLEGRIGGGALAGFFPSGSFD